MTASAALAGKPVMEQLKEATLDQHTSAEGHPFQRALAGGSLPKEQYVANLAQMFLVHRALEDELRRAASGVSGIARVVREYQYQVPYLLADLAFFGIDPPGIRPAPATQRLIE